jgi:O-acetyl-ADP-ribose deacetylase (regulator of RNase III)
MNPSRYEILVRSCIKDLFEICLGKDVPEEILAYPKISAPRIFLEYVLTSYVKPIPYFITNKIDQILQWELSRKQLILPQFIPRLPMNPFISLCQCDLTLIYADCIVNIFDPSDSTGLGCWKPGHKCIDNLIHTRAGPLVRAECDRQIRIKLPKPGELFTTPSFNLPSKCIFHVMAPVYGDYPHDNRSNEEALREVYLNSLEKMRERCLRTIIFPCLPTSKYAYPRSEASKIALQTVDQWIKSEEYACHVIFCMRTDEEVSIYETCIGLYLA